MGDYQLGKKNMRDNLSAVVVASDPPILYTYGGAGAVLNIHSTYTTKHFCHHVLLP